MKVRVIDFETTGLPNAPLKAICEYAYTDLDLKTLELGPTISELINPGHPIPPVTQAIHHISDRDVAGKKSPTWACQQLAAGMDAENDFFAAHNAPFEQVFFGGGSVRWICTMKAAKALIPDAPSFSNQTLRYYLGLDLDEERAMPPHRAGADTYVTAMILLELLKRASAEELHKLLKAPLLLKKISFGKHKGKPWSQVDRGYLEWVVDSAKFSGDVLHTAKHHLRAGR